MTSTRENVIADDRAEFERVVCAARDGDDGAFTELYRRFFRMVRAVLLARVSQLDVDDLAQEVFLQAWRRLGSLRDPLAFGGWLRQIAVHHSATHRRRVHDTETLAPDLALAPHDEEAWFLLAEVRRLPQAYRETLVLRFVEGMTGPEIAELTGLTPESVRVNLHRGVKLLRGRLKGGAR